jgi:alternate signal-mediated exported protein
VGAAAWWAPAGIGIAAVLLIGGGSYALWSATATSVAGTVTAGDLRVTTGTVSWVQVTPGVGAGASGTLPLEGAGSPSEFLAMPGDVVRFRVPARTMLRGDNLAGGMFVDFEDADAVAQDVAAGLVSVSYHVEDAAGVPVTGEQAPGAAVVVPGLVGDNDGVTADWTVVVTVEVLGDYRWVVSPDDGARDWAAGNLVVRVDQVRTGAGFLAGGAP